MQALAFLGCQNILDRKYPRSIAFFDLRDFYTLISSKHLMLGNTIVFKATRKATRRGNNKNPFISYFDRTSLVIISIYLLL